MPFINVKTNAKLPKEKKEIIKRRLFDSISIIPGKSDGHLMIAVEDKIDMAFHRDSNTLAAMVEVKLLGASTKDAYHKLTSEICMIMSDEANVNGDSCYVRFEETTYWGYNGFMF